MVSRTVSLKVLFLLVFVVTLGWGICQGAVDVVTEPYLLDTGLVSRSISFENPTGAPGEGRSLTIGVAEETDHPQEPGKGGDGDTG